MSDNPNIRATVSLTADKASAEATKRLLQEVKNDVKDLGKGGQLKGVDAAFDTLNGNVTDASKKFDTLRQKIDKAKESAVSLSKTKIDTFEGIDEANFAAPASESGGGGGSPPSRDR